ncbi:MAG: 3'(2'),5'-bisphosphate nucleotidase [Planctomycetota bacterium]
MSEQTKRIEAAKLAVSRASVVCREVQARLADVQSLLKDDRSPVTVADFASQAVVAWTLKDLLGSCPMVGEEDAHELREQIAAGNTSVADQVLDAASCVWDGATMDAVLDAIDLGNADSQQHKHGFWTLDPIDGTKGFLRNQQYAVALGWIEHGDPVLGVLGCPNLSRDQSFPLDEKDPNGSMYVAIAGEGCWEYPADEPGAEPAHIRRLERSDGEPVRMCESAESGHTSHDDAERILERLGEAAEPARLDSQAKYAVVARGQGDLYLRLPRPGKPYVERIWDHAAGSIVAREAGCAVTDIAGLELDFSHGAGLEKNRGIVVGDVKLHGLAMGAINELQIGQA